MPHRRQLAGLLWPASLIVLPLLFWWQIAFAGRVLVGVDLFTYFYPLRDYTSSVLLAGRLPLWNPYLFLGVPLLANSQAGVFYPLNLLLVRLPAPIATNASILIHLALAGLGAYLLGRRWLGMGRPGAWTAGALYPLGGFLSAQAEHVNQLAVSAWLPWLLLLFAAAVRDAPATSGEAQHPAQGRLRWRVIALLAVLVAVSFLAGHTQAWYISMFSLGLTALGTAIGRAWRQAKAGLRPASAASTAEETTEVVTTRRSGSVVTTSVVSGWAALWPRALVLLVVAGWGIALSAPQLLSTLELSGLSIRGGGLSYREVVAFSLKPQLLLRALLPGYGESVFSEYVAYVGWIGLALAGLGLWRARRRRVWWAGAGLALAGLFLAFGGYNPFYYVLYRLVPGFGLFRAPARWLVLYALGMALLAGAGLDAWMEPPAGSEPAGGWLRRRRRLALASAALAVAAVSALAFLLWRGWLERPTWPTVAGWVVAIALIALVAWVRKRWDADERGRARTGGSADAGTSARPFSAFLRVHPRSSASVFLPFAVLALLAELFLAGRALALATPTAWDAFSALRTAPAHLLAAGERVGRDGRPLDDGGTPAPLGDITAHWGAGAPTFRFISMSGIRYDPGDLGEIQALWGARLSEKAVYDFVVATKYKEVLSPNLPLLYRIASLDGYDGGVLPLKRYVTLQRLLLSPEQILPDGRLREQLRQVPPAKLLSLLNVEFVITDKVQDVWLDDVFYDRQFQAVLGEAEVAGVDGEVKAEVEVENPYAFVATAFGIICRSEGAGGLPAGTPLALLSWTDEAGQRQERTLRTDENVAEGRDQPARLRLDAPTRPTDIRLRWVGPQGRLIAGGLTMIDERTGANRSLIVSGQGRFRLVHSGDVKIYRNLDNLPRAYWVAGGQMIAGDDEAVAAMRAADFDPAGEVILHEGTVLASGGGAGRVEIVTYSAERVDLSVEADAPGYLVLADADYPGWVAYVDGQPAPIRRANVMFRAVALPAGQHTVTFRYEPAWLWPGAALSLLAAAGLLLVLVVRTRRR